MPAATFVPGSAFRVTVDTTDYSAQVTGGGVTAAPAVERIRTLTSVVYPQSDVEDTATVEWLYDEETGLYGALWACTRDGSTVDVEITGGGAAWTGTGMVVTNLSQPFTAEDGATRATVELAGVFAYAAVTP